MTQAPAADGARGPGISSRMRRGGGPYRLWTSPHGPAIEFPVIFDLVMHDDDSREVWRVEATLDLVDHQPAVVEMRLAATRGLSVERLQREFRWATPLEAVTRLAPAMIQEGRNPYDEEFPATGYPDNTRDVVARRRLTDEFLEDVAREYLTIGRGYAKTLAERYSVSPRTVVGWIEKARERGILTATRRGQAGGTVRSGSPRAQPDAFVKGRSADPGSSPQPPQGV